MPKAVVAAPSGIYNSTLPALQKACNHVWATYTGFTDSYDYCKLCNEKRT